jgi:hypothetical protein
MKASRLGLVSVNNVSVVVLELKRNKYITTHYSEPGRFSWILKARSQDETRENVDETELSMMLFTRSFCEQCVYTNHMRITVEAQIAN